MKKLLCLFISFLSLFNSEYAIARNAQAAFYLGLDPEIATPDDTIIILGTPTFKRRILKILQYVNIELQK